MVQRGEWCPSCALAAMRNRVSTGSRRKKTIEDMNAVAAARGGRCLSEQYTNPETSLLWECAQGHRWEATAGGVVYHRTWCPLCDREKRRRRLPKPH
jgi:hypothetical protein